MEYRTLEINVISAKDLKDISLFTKMDVYSVVSISGDPHSKQRTTVDRNGGTNPTWNCPVKFTINESAAQQNSLILMFQLRCERILGDKDIGELQVPVKELLDTMGDDKPPVQFVSRWVMKPSGKPKGVLHFSYKFGEKFTDVAAVVRKADEPMTAYPAPMVGTSSAYPPPPPVTTPYAPTGPYPQPVAGYEYPPPPPVAGYGYPPPPPPTYGGYPPPPQPGYGYPPQPGFGYPPVQQPEKKNKFGLGLGAGLLGGAVGGLLIGDMVSDAAAYDAGFGDCGDF